MIEEPIHVYSLDTDVTEKYVVSACSDAKLRLYNLKEDNLDPIAVLSGHEGPVLRALYTHFGEIIVSGDFSGKVIVWKAEDGVYIKKVEQKVSNGPVNDLGVRYSESMLTVFCGLSDGFLVTLRLTNSFEVSEERKQIHRFEISALSCNDECLVTGSRDMTVRVQIGEKEYFTKNHESLVTAVAVAPSNAFSKVIFATGDSEGRLCIVEAKNDDFKTQVIELGEPCNSLWWSRGGFILSAGYGEGSFKCYILGESGEFEEVETKNE